MRIATGYCNYRYIMSSFQLEFRHQAEFPLQWHDAGEAGPNLKPGFQASYSQSFHGVASRSIERRKTQP
jgi:hypothetical protein